MLAYNAFELIACAAAAVEPYVTERDSLPDNWISELTTTQRVALARFLDTLTTAACCGQRDLRTHYKS